MHSHIAQGKEEIRDRCFCMVVGRMGEKLGKQLCIQSITAIFLLGI